MAKKTTANSKEKILIVEDDPAIIDVYSIALGQEGFKVIKASNGQEGLEQAEAEKPDLILLDILMPVMDGLEMLKRLRETEKNGKKIPVMILTNLSAGNEDIVKTIAETEPLYYIVKSSTTPKQMTDKVKEYFSSLKK